MRDGCVCTSYNSYDGEDIFPVPFTGTLPTKTSMRAVGSRFDLSESTVHRILLRVADYIMRLSPTTLTFPTDLEKLSKGLETVSVVKMLTHSVSVANACFLCTEGHM